jgi:hypothetical protein
MADDEIKRLSSKLRRYIVKIMWAGPEQKSIKNNKLTKN